MKRWSLLVAMSLAFGCSSKAKTGGGGGDGNSVLERNNHPSRDGNFVQPLLTHAAAATMAADTGFAPSFTGSMWASPLYIENGPKGKGAFIAATTNNDVVALDEATGATLWTKSIGTPATGNNVGCSSGNNGTPSVGILSTPVIDGQSRTVYVAGATGDTSDIQDHVASAFAIEDGSVRSGWPVDVSGKLQFDPAVHNQRSALSLVGGVVYIAYGGFVGDCGTYHGRVVAIEAGKPQNIAGWATAGQGEGIWAAAGMASDGTGVFATTGNRTGGGSATHQDSEEVVRITGMGTKGSAYFPSRWQGMDSSDADMASSNPIIIQQPGSTPATMVAQFSKDGHLYLLDPANLGGMDGHKVDYQFIAGGGMLIHTAPAAYKTAQGLYIVLSTDGSLLCPQGGGGHVVAALKITPGNPPSPNLVWCSPNLTGPSVGPIATTTDGQADAIVWFISGGQLVGVDGDTGAVLYTSTDTCAGVKAWTSPIAVKGRIVVGGDGKLCSWSPH
jgi:hypothetical protein